MSKLLNKENYHGQERKVGLEVEYAALPLKKAADIVCKLFGGKVEKETDALFKVVETTFGDFTLELDAIPLQKVADNTKKLQAKTKRNVMDELHLNFGKALSEAGEEFAPFEIVAPPIKISQLPELEKLRDALRKAGAKDTKENFYSAFGLHINPEVASLDAEYIIRHLQSFLLLAPWLKQLHKIDITRRVSSFIDPFPKSYMKLVLDNNYAPDIERMIRDYHEHNPTRNRALDMLPLFAHIDEKLVRKLYGKKEKINKRPTFHYRLPNCELADESWSFDKEWKHWLHVEVLANDIKRLHQLMEQWQEHQEHWFSFESEWVDVVEKQMIKNEGYNKPLIGVTTSASKGYTMWWCTRLGVKLSGGRAVRITALNEKDYKKCDGYIISGGVDVDPESYGQENRASVGVEPERDSLEKKVISHALKHQKSLMGICRGAQMINIVKGGTLHQDARDFYENFIPSDSLLGKIFSRRLIHIIKDGLLCSLFKEKPELSVNSLHHQAINKLGNGLQVVAEDEHGIVQAIESNDLDKNFILGVQWHPEFMLHSKAHRKLFRTFVKSAVR